MSEVREVTGTAFVVAEFRARENEEARPLYVDAIVPIFLDARTREAADRIRADFPAGENMPRLHSTSGGFKDTEAKELQVTP